MKTNQVDNLIRFRLSLWLGTVASDLRSNKAQETTGQLATGVPEVREEKRLKAKRKNKEQEMQLLTSHESRES